MAVSTCFWIVAWVLSDLFLLLSLVAVAAKGEDDPIGAVWLGTGTLAVIAALNAYGIGAIGF